MEPLASAVYVMIGAAALLGMILGAFAGTIAWAIQRSLQSLFLLAAAGYFALTVLLGPVRFASAGEIGIPPLILTMLTSWLTARYLETNARFRRIWAALAALGCALLLGSLWIILLGFWLTRGREGLSATVWLALLADIGLIVLYFRSRKAATRGLAAG